MLLKRIKCPSRPLTFLILWYIFSAFTLFLNKHILTTLQGDPTLLGTTQMAMTLTCGFIQMRFLPCGMGNKKNSDINNSGRPPGFFRHMVLVGAMRFSTVLLGLIALNYVAVSFTETIKSSAPLFTVLISRLILNERTSLAVNLSLIPVMGGLALCSWNEISFDFWGFSAALLANFTECLQNVYSKMLISGERYRYSPAELQFYTSISAMIVQLPISYLLVDVNQININSTLPLYYIINGIFFHFQSISAYVLMDYISPVTHSVANTVKRALLIWLSVLLFQNKVTLLSGLGSFIVFFGVVLYNNAKNKSDNAAVVVFEPRHYESGVVEF